MKSKDTNDLEMNLVYDDFVDFAFEVTDRIKELSDFIVDVNVLNVYVDPKEDKNFPVLYLVIVIEDVNEESDYISVEHHQNINMQNISQLNDLVDQYADQYANKLFEKYLEDIDY